MCYSPVLIKNPNRGRTDKLSYVVDTVSQYIPVPCGHCGECIRKKATDVLQRAQLEEKYGWPFFISLSYSPEALPHYECSNGYQIPYADVSDLQNMFKRLRKSGSLTRRFRYYAVTELGSLRGRPHAHILMFLERLPEDHPFTPYNLEKIVFREVLKEWRRNVAVRYNKKGEIVPDNVHPDYRPLLRFVRRFRGGRVNCTYDCHYVEPTLSGTTEDVSFYVTKYLFKDSEYKYKLKRCIFGKLDSNEEALEVWSKVRPRGFSSLNFGFGYYGDLNPRKVSAVVRREILSSLPSADIVRKAVDLSSKFEKTPRFYDLQTGKSMPLARYWYKFGDIYDFDHHNVFLSRQDRLEGGVSVDDRDMTSKIVSEEKFVKNSSDCLLTNYDLLYAEF